MSDDRGGGVGYGTPGSMTAGRVGGGGAGTVQLGTIRDRVVVEPVTPITLLLTSGREIHAATFHPASANVTDPEDAAVIVVDEAGYMYVVASDTIEAAVVHADLVEEMLAP